MGKRTVRKVNKGINVEENNRFKNIKKRKEKKWKKKEKIKRKTPQNCKSPTQRQMFITKIKNVTEYRYTYTLISEIKTVQQKQSTID